ncbi:MAG: hypothetical protein M1824_005214 [Vezdaea acicularis]|nr:MAG: hypothetical protein M1824_005214 [Vezdaea acicularis]
MDYIPYHPRMRLGQGFNSYTQQTCLQAAVDFPSSTEIDDPHQPRPSQRLVLSHECVTRPSQLARTLNLSAADTIASGGFRGGRFGGVVDEEKFRDADFSFVVTAKVGRGVWPDEKARAVFKPFGRLSSAEFLKIYGDRYISGFESGGELIGIVYVKMIDADDAAVVKAKLHDILATILVKSPEESDMESLSHMANLSISATFAKGAIYEPISQTWALRDLLETITEFFQYAKAADERIHAVVKPYDSLPSFVAASGKPVLPSYSPAIASAMEMLDDFYTFKQLEADARAMQSSIEEYTISEADNHFEASMRGAIDAHKEIRGQMMALVKCVNDLQVKPELASTMALGGRKYNPPAQLRARLPVIQRPPTLPARPSSDGSVYSASSRSRNEVSDNQD